MKFELIIIPISAFSERLNFFVVENSLTQLNFPTIQLSDHIHLKNGIQILLKKHFADHASLKVENRDLENWLNSIRFNDRVVEVYDSDFLQEGENRIAIVRAVPIPDQFAFNAQGAWYEARHLLDLHSKLSQDNKVFLKDCLNLIPIWVKNTSFTFELMNNVFSIQELRLLVGMLSNQEIDPGNFHRRLKKLDILRPLGDRQQRVHKWEFAWERSPILSIDGLIP